MVDYIPIQKQDRQSDIFLGDGGPIYGPFDFKIFDEDDVEVWTMADGEDFFSLQLSVLVLKQASLPLDSFTITFPAGQPVTTKIVVRSARQDSRAAGVRKGTGLDPDAMEKEFSKIATLMQEFRRDMNRAWLSDFGVPGLKLDANVADGDTLMKLGDRLTKGANALDIANAQQNAELAQEAAEDAAEIRDEVAALTAYNPVVRKFTTTNAGPYNMTVAIGTAAKLDVKLGGVLLDHDLYTVAGTNFTFLEDPGAGLPIEAVLRGDVRNVSDPADASVKIVSLDPGVVPYFDARYDARYEAKGGRTRGSFDPFVKGSTSAGTATYQSARGTWRQENGMVHFELELVWTGHTGIGDLTIGGLPKVSACLNSPVFMASSNIGFAGQDLQGTQLAKTTDVLLQTRYAGGGPTTPVPVATIGTLRLAGFYPADDNSDIAFVGDSVTYGKRPGVLETDTFRFKVQNALSWAIGYNGGVSGENASEGEARFAALLTAASPQAVCIMFGINDFYDPLPAATYKTKLQSMVAMAQGAGAKVTLCSPNATPDPAMIAGFGPWLTAVQDVGTTPGVIYVPVYEAFEAKRAVLSSGAYAALFADGIQHPGPTGHDLITATILATPGACRP
ncbi:hypothetical protein HF272_13780 [Rhizobium leguminosarum]|uniref:SGNH/GDSL hydrolase family protein n=1 Tax=Rhizobium leguminosarum TaxID=384 RepID=UPI001C924DBB|nr:GDSL-type esterase/lipase family protein [Rhizobium leguminosarum]MBY2992500.1 hypothetical protein [Rhizobium leguminosarum]